MDTIHIYGFVPRLTLKAGLDPPSRTLGMFNYFRGCNLINNTSGCNRRFPNMLVSLYKSMFAKIVSLWPITNVKFVLTFSAGSKTLDVS